MQVPIMSGTKRTGTLEACQQGLYTKFTGRLQADGLCRVYGVFSGGEISLGIPVPEGERLYLRATMPTSQLPKGQLLSGKIVYEKERWQPFPGGTIGGVCYPAGEKKGHTLRFCWKVGEPLPADEVCCFYAYREMQGRSYLLLRLDENGVPYCSE